MDIQGFFRPSTDHVFVGRLFIRLLSLIYFAAFFSLAGQISGLVGVNGILPFGETLSAMTNQYGQWAWLRLPTLFWLDSSDSALSGVAWLGCLLALLLLFGIANRICLILLFALYLSLFHAGQMFLNFPWDYLLLEAGFLAVFTAKGACPAVPNWPAVIHPGRG